MKQIKAGSGAKGLIPAPCKVNLRVADASFPAPEKERALPEQKLF